MRAWRRRDDNATATTTALIPSALGAKVRREKETSMRRMIAAAATVIALGGHADAQEWPTRPITLIVPFAAAAGMAGGARVAKAAPDGYTLLIGNTGTHAFNQSLYKRPLYNAATDFEPV